MIYGWDGGNNNNQWLEFSKRNPAVAPHPRASGWQKTILRGYPGGHLW